MIQQEVKRACPRATQILGEIVKLPKSILMLMAKEQVDGLAVVLIVGMNHMFHPSCETI